MPPDPTGGASAHVRDAGCCVSLSSKFAVSPIPFSAATKKQTCTTTTITTTTTTTTSSTTSNNVTIVPSINKHFANNGNLDEAGISPPPPYTTIYPPSPPSSAPSSPTAGPVSSATLLTPPSSAVVSPSVLSTVFPGSSPVHSMASNPIDLTQLVPSWKGALLEDSNTDRKTLYIVGGHYDEVNLRDAVCGVLEKAEDELSADAVVIVLEKNQAELSDLLHSLMYVGGTIVTQTQLSPNPAYLLVGLDV